MGRDNKLKMSIVIPSYNNADKTRLCLKYLFLQEEITDCNIEVIVVDDCSDVILEEKISDMMRPHGAFSSVRIIRNKKNMGLAASRNVGAAASKGEIILFLDNDIVLDKDNLLHHIQVHRQNVNAVCISRIFDVNRENFNQTIQELNSWKTLDSEYMERNLETKMDPLFSMREEILNERTLEDRIIWPFGAFFCTSLTRESFSRAGGFDENYKGWGPEDVDFSYRLFMNDAHFIYCDKAVCYHLDNGRKNKEKLIHDISVNSRYMFKKYSRNSQIRAYLNFYKGSISFEEFEAIIKGEEFKKDETKNLHYIGILRFIDFKCEQGKE